MGLLLPFLCVVCFVELLLTWYVLLESGWYGEYDITSLGIFALIFYGIFASLKTARNDSRFKTRRERMDNQCGHTVMLLYFWGLAPITEVYQLYRNAGSKQQMLNAIQVHVLAETVIHSIMRYWLFPISTYMQYLNIGLFAIISVLFIGFKVPFIAF